MKQLTISVMAAAMPYMSWLVWLGVLLLAAALIATAATALFGKGASLARRASALALCVGIIFVACQVVGWLLGMSPQINFEQFTGKAFDLRPFWQIGVGFVVPALVMMAIARRRQTNQA
jgi:heme/copper-type cytochrome/quinol oxidase subunit 3